MVTRSKQKAWIVFIVMLTVTLVFSVGWVHRAIAQEPQNPSGISGSSINLLYEAEFTCTIVNVTVYTSRIHVRCSNPQTVGTDTVYYYASASDAETIRTTNQFLILLNTAVALNKPVGDRYETSSTANPAGCLTGNCRKLIGVFLTP